MTVIKKNAPRRGINAWREYFQWVEEKGKQGQFRGDLKRLEQLEGPICAKSAFSNLSRVVTNAITALASANLMEN